MSSGRLDVELDEADLNLLFSRVEPGTRFQQGCFLIHRKLPLGFGATLVAIPRQQGPDLLIAVPFDQIRGDRLGGLAGTAAKALWGILSGQVQKMADKAMLSNGLPRETVRIESIPGGGAIRISLVHVNYWLGQRPQSGLTAQLARADFRPTSMCLAFDVETPT